MIPNFDARKIEEMARKIEHNGYVELHSFFDDKIMTKAVDWVKKEREKKGQSTFGLRKNEMKGSIFQQIADDQEFIKLLDSVLRELGFPTPKDTDVHTVLRALVGVDAKEQAHKYHFDAYHITASMPIEIPESNDRPCGDFYFFCRKRGGKSGFLSNLIFKLILQNRIAHKAAKLNFVRQTFGFQAIKTKPGNLYLFHGFATYHGNGDIHPSFKRSTILFHYADPFEDSKLVKWIERRRNNRKVGIARL